MRSICILLGLAAIACGELRSTKPDVWLELESEHFDLRTDLEDADAAKALRDLEFLRNAVVTAGWRMSGMSNARIHVVLLSSERELHEFVKSDIGGITSVDRFGERLIIVGGSNNLLHVYEVKHELAHAIMDGFLVTNPRWVQEGIACYLESLEVDPEKGTAVRGGWRTERMNNLHFINPLNIDWSYVMTYTGADSFDRQTLSWALVHWLADTYPREFRVFLGGLARGEPQWTAFHSAFPRLDEAALETGMGRYLTERSIHEERVNVPAWSGQISSRRISAADAYALRAELYYGTYGDWPGDKNPQLQAEAQKALLLDPGHPLALALSQKRDAKLAVDRHPDDWRSWEVWFEDHPKDGAAIRKAAELAPDNPHVLLLLALSEQSEGKPAEALAAAERASKLKPSAGAYAIIAHLHELNGRCDEAIASQRRAIEAITESLNRNKPLEYRQRLGEIERHCGKKDQEAERVVQAEPVLKSCAKTVRLGATVGAFAHFTIREDGTVAQARVEGVPPERRDELQDFVQSCSFEPVLVEGKARSVQLDIRLIDLVP
jgi:hypothetical protein